MFSLLILAVALMPVADLFSRAAKRSGHSQKELAYAMGTTPPRLTHMLRNEGSSLSLARLFEAPATFRAALLAELYDAWGCERPLTARDVIEMLKEREDRCA